MPYYPEWKAYLDRRTDCPSFYSPYQDIGPRVLQRVVPLRRGQFRPARTQLTCQLRQVTTCGFHPQICCATQEVSLCCLKSRVPPSHLILFAAIPSVKKSD